MSMSGLSVDGALAALRTNTEHAMKAGAPDLHTSQRIAMAKMMRRPLPQRTVTDPTSNQQNTPGTANSRATADRIRNAATGNATTPPNAAQGIGGLNPPFVGPQRPAWYEEPGWVPRKINEAWQGLKDSFDSSKRGNVIPNGY